MIIITIAQGIWLTLCQMAPYLLVGFLFAGVLSVLISPEFVERHLGGRGLWPVLKASIFGVPLPLCSCGVIPVAASLRRHGASRGATLSFLLSTPQTGADNILLVYGLLGPVFAVFSPIAAFFTGIVGGSATELADRSEEGADDEPARCMESCCSTNHDESHGGQLMRILKYGFVTIAGDIAKPLAVGLLIAGMLTALVPNDFFRGALGSGITGILLMMLLGVPIYVCASASVPIAAALMLKGVSAGAALAFLITGPATNAATIATIWKVLGRRTAFIYLATILVSALGLGLLLNLIFVITGATPTPHMAEAHQHPETIGPVHIAAAVALLGVLAYGLLRRKPAKVEPALGDVGPETIMLRVTGMTCGHCAERVRDELLHTAGVAAAEVNLKTGEVRVTGTNLAGTPLCEAVKAAGYAATLPA